MAKTTEQKSWKFDNLSINSDEVSYWEGEVKLGRDFRKKKFYNDESNKGRAVDCYNYYKGTHSILDEGLETPVVDNQIRPIVNTFVSALDDNVDILVKMKRATVPYQKEITKSVFGYFRTELKTEWHDEQCKVDAFITGLGVKNNGYNSEFDEMSWKEKKKKTVKKKKGRKFVEEEIEEELVRRKEWITKEFPFNERHSPFMTIVDPRAKSAFPYDGKWICLEYELPYSEVTANPEFENTKDLGPSGAVGVAKDKIDWKDLKKGMCHLYQIQIARKDGLYILTLAKDYKEPLRYIKYPFKIEGFLTKFLTFNDSIDEFYPPNDIEPLIPLQDEINWMQSKILEACYKFLPKIGVNSDFFKDETEMMNTLKKGDIASILVNHGQATPNQATQVLNFTLDLRDKMAVLQILKNEMRLISGVTEAELTGQTDAKTATEANIGARGSFTRISKRRKRIKRFLVEDQRIFKQIVVQACSWPLITKITGLREVGQDGTPITEMWLRLNSIKANLVGEFDLDLDLISTNQANLEIAKRQVLESANFLFSPVVEQALAREGMKVDKVTLIKEFLRTQDQFRTEDLVVPMTPEEQQALQQQMMLQAKGGQMATAPQAPTSPMQGEAQSAGELLASVQGSL